ncbi:hypothetical protein ABD566_001429 [Salmonella enterica]
MVMNVYSTTRACVIYFEYTAVIWQVNKYNGPAASYAGGLFSNDMSGMRAYDAAAIFFSSGAAGQCTDDFPPFCPAAPYPVILNDGNDNLRE